MGFADAHVHLFPSGFFGRYGRPCSGGDDLVIYDSLRREHGIDVALVAGYEGESRYAGNNEHVAALRPRHDWVVPLAFTSLRRPQIPHPQFAGISLFLSDATDAQSVADWPRSLVAEMSGARLIVSVNADLEAISLVADTLRRLEGCEILISHLGQPGSYESTPSRSRALAILEPLIGLADAAHVGVKVSGLYDISIPAHAYPHQAAAPFIDCLAEAFGTERLYWGSDFSPALDFVSFAQTIDAVSRLGWTDTEREAVMGANLMRVLERMRAREPD